MEHKGRTLENVRWFMKRPESRLFLVELVTIVVVIAGIVLFGTSSLFAFGATGVLLVIASINFFTLYQAATLTQSGAVERNQLKGIVTTMGDALVAYDQDFRVIFFNPAAERVFGLKAEAVRGVKLAPELLQKPEYTRLVQVTFPSLAPTMVTRSAAGQYPQIVDISFVDPVLELRTTTTPIADEHGALIGFTKIIHDRTRETGLLKSKTEFVTVASHQLRTPLTHVAWALENLSADTTLSAEAKDLVANALSASNQLKVVVEDLLSVSRIEDGRFGYEFQPTNLVEFLEKILSQVEPQARRVGIKLYFDPVKGPLPQVMIDAKKLSMAFTNLLDNAIRYNVQNGEVTVGVKKANEGPYLEITIKDTGIGIPEEEVKKLFAKFYRASNAVKFSTDGSGLGLYIAQNIIRAHGGTIWVESETNRGTTFHFTIPTDPTLVPQHEVARDE